MTTLPDRIASGEVEAPDVFCGGTPCQAFSVAGARKSLDDARGNLSLTFCEIANAIDTARAGHAQPPAIVFWENVPGVLSTKDNAFGCFLAELAGEDEPIVPTGEKWSNAGAVFGPQRAVAWRVLDAQYFGVAQRRRRVFVVASARNGFDPAAVLFEFDGLRRDSAPSREAGQGIARGVEIGSFGGRLTELNPTLDARAKDVPIRNQLAGAVLQTFDFQSSAQYGEAPVAATLSARDFKSAKDLVAQPMVVHGTQDPCVSDIAFAQGRNNGGENVLAFQSSQSGVRLGETHATLDANNGPRRHNGALVGMAVRRLTPVECERLQGFPDNYTAIPWRNKPASECPDGPRYKALGNSWAVPNVRWIGRRIQLALDIAGGAK